MEVIDWNAIPAWFVGVNLLLAGFMWLVTRNTTIRMDSRIWGNTFVLIGLLFLMSHLNMSGEVSLERKVIGSRLMLVLIAFSNWFPLLISAVRHTQRVRDYQKKVINGLIGNIDNISSDSE